VDLVGADADLCAKPELAAVIKARRRVVENRR
jgi:hypothetical protein